MITRKIGTVGEVKAALGEGVLAEFEAVLTTKQEDRDGDVLEPAGAKVDPAMALLWAHDSDQVLGKLISVTEHDSEKLAGRFVLADTALGRDALKLLKMGALRVSHGFTPTKYAERKSSAGTPGWHVREFEILEASLVAVPSNTEAVITSLRSEKFATPQVKDFVRGLVLKGSAIMAKQKDGVDNSDANAELTKAITAAVAETITPLAERVEKIAGDVLALKGTPDEPAKKGGLTAKDIFGGVRTKDPSERYDNLRRETKHFRTGRHVADEHGRAAYLPSEMDNAKAGAFLKFLGRKAGLDCPLSEHEESLLGETFAQDTWCGTVGGIYSDSIPGERAKALLDGATSGGAEVVPVFFDSAVIQFPLLYSELYPFVDVMPVPRGRLVEGSSIGNPSVVWGTADGTAQTAFDTALLVVGINTTIFPVSVNIEFGRDFLADAAVDVGRRIVDNIGQRMAAELDEVIANGNGTSQPQGIFQAAGMTDIGNPAAGAGGVAVVGDWEDLYFSVAKQYRNAAFNPCFLANDTSYSRARAIAVGAADQRRVFGMDESSYQLLSQPFRIENNLANTQQCFAALKKYRLYRRAAQSVQWTTEGRTLTQANLALLNVRGRFGGRVVDMDAFSLQTNAEA